MARTRPDFGLCRIVPWLETFIVYCIGEDDINFEL
jgi:hypothetical protein